MKIIAAAIAVLLVATAPASAQDKPVTLKLSHWVPASHPLQKAIQDWAEDVKKASNGSINYLVFPSEQLGKAFDHYDMARDGIADFSYVNPGYQPGRFPSSQRENCPSSSRTLIPARPRSTPLVPSLCGPRDEGCALLFRLRA